MVVASKIGIEATLVSTVSNLQKKGCLGAWSELLRASGSMYVRAVTARMLIFCPGVRWAMMRISLRPRARINGVMTVLSSGASLLIMSARRRCVSTAICIFCCRVVLTRVAGALLNAPLLRAASLESCPLIAAIAAWGLYKYKVPKKLFRQVILWTNRRCLIVRMRACRAIVKTPLCW